MQRPLRPLLALVAATLACGRAAPAPGVDSARAATPTRTASRAMTADSLRLHVDVPAEVALGEPVPVGVRAENTSGKPLTLYLRGRAPTLDLRVTGEHGDTVWHRLADAVIPAIVRIHELAPGEALALGDSWPQRTNRGAPVPAGTYVVHATLLTDTPDGLAFPPATLRIRAR